MNPLHDDELNSALHEWQTPDPPMGLEAKTMAACHPHFRGAPVWRRWLTMKLSVPLPVAAAVIVLLALLSAILARVELRSPAAQTPPATEAHGASDLPWGGMQPVSVVRARIIRGDR